VDRAGRRPDRDFAACHDGITPIREAAMRSQALAHAIPIEQVDLEALDRFLMSDRSPPDSMMLSDLDGFLTGIAVGPELVLPSEWLPLVWGGEAPEFADESEAKAVLGAIMARYNEILPQIADDTFDPIFWTARGGTLIAADWAEGFLQAIMLRMDAWDAQVQARWPAADPDPGALRRRKRRIVAWPAAGRRGPHHAGGGRVRSGVRHRDRRLLAQKRTEANLDAAHARPIASSAPIRKQGWSQRSVPLRVRQEVQEMLQQGRLKNKTRYPWFSPDAYP
jgi:yecA family protein